MPCDLENLDVRVPCSFYAGSRTQMRLLAQFLCAVATEVIPDYTCDLAEVVAPAGVCVGEAAYRQKTAEIIGEGLGVDWRELNCYTDAQVERAIADLTCRIVQAINP